MIVNYKMIAHSICYQNMCFFKKSTDILSLSNRFQNYLDRTPPITNVMVADIMLRRYDLPYSLVIRLLAAFFLGALSTRPSAFKINDNYFSYPSYIASPFFKIDPKGIFFLSLIMSAVPAELDIAKDIFSKVAINGSHYPMELDKGRTFSSIIVPVMNMILLMVLQKMAENRVKKTNEFAIQRTIQNKQNIGSIISKNTFPYPLFMILKLTSISMSAYLGILFNGLVLIDRSITDDQINDTLKKSIKYIVSFLYCFYPVAQFKRQPKIDNLRVIHKGKVYQMTIHTMPLKQLNRLHLMVQLIQCSLASLYFSNHILRLDEPDTILNHTFIFWVASSSGLALIINLIANKYIKSDIVFTPLSSEQNDERI